MPQADKDERDLRSLVIGGYVFSGLLALGTLAFLGVLLFSAFWTDGLSLVFGLISVVFGLLYAYANYNSARAIAAREEPQLSFFVAGLNAMTLFPLGAIISYFTYSVLCRPSVRDIYADPHRPPSLTQNPITAAGKIKSKIAEKKAAAAAFSEPIPNLKDLDDAEEALWRQMEEDHKKKKAQEAMDKIKIVSPQDDSSSG